MKPPKSLFEIILMPNSSLKTTKTSKIEDKRVEKRRHTLRTATHDFYGTEHEMTAVATTFMPLIPLLWLVTRE